MKSNDRHGQILVELRKTGAISLEELMERLGASAASIRRDLSKLHNIRNRRNLRVITNAINIAMELCNCEGLQTFVTGGFVQWAGSFSMVGQGAINFLNDIYMDKVFISVCGISLERGVTVIEPEESLTFRAMIHQAKVRIVVADSSKLGMVTPALVCPISEINMLITDSRAPDKSIAPFTERGIEVKRV